METQEVTKKINNKLYIIVGLALQFITFFCFIEAMYLGIGQTFLFIVLISTGILCWCAAHFLLYNFDIVIEDGNIEQNNDSIQKSEDLKGE